LDIILSKKLFNFLQQKNRWSNLTDFSWQKLYLYTTIINSKSFKTFFTGDDEVSFISLTGSEYLDLDLYVENELYLFFSGIRFWN
jgi:hypothetical protein